MAKVKILFLGANPTDTSRLKLDEEVRAITEKIRIAEYRDSLDLIAGWAVRADDLLQLLNLHKPHIVHFSGHGNPSGEILVIDNNGRTKPVNPIALKALFTTLKDNIQIVILNACYSKIQAQAIVEVIDYTIGMNAAIGDQSAIIFAASFYRALGFGRSVQEAFDQGKTALLLEGVSGNNIPELLIKVGANPSQTFFQIVLSDSPQSLLKALANEIIFNLGKLDSFVHENYRIVNDRIISNDEEDAALNYFSCMISVFESVELQKVLSITDKELRDKLFKIYMGFREINEKADALKQVFRPRRASQYIDAITLFEKNIRPIAEIVTRELQPQ